MSCKILIRSITAQVIMTLVLINMMFNVEYCKNFGKVKVALILQILIVGFRGISDIGQEEDLQIMNDKLI